VSWLGGQVVISFAPVIRLLPLGLVT
jgi:hypothetical protein